MKTVIEILLSQLAQINDAQRRYYIVDQFKQKGVNIKGSGGTMKEELVSHKAAMRFIFTTQDQEHSATNHVITACIDTRNSRVTTGFAAPNKSDHFEYAMDKQGLQDARNKLADFITRIDNQLIKIEKEKGYK